MAERRVAGACPGLLILWQYQIYNPYSVDSDREKMAHRSASRSAETWIPASSDRLKQCLMVKSLQQLSFPHLL